MDPATIIGLVIAFGSLVAMINLEGSTVSSVILIPPMLLVFVGTIAVGMAGSTFKDFIFSFKSLPRAFLSKPASPGGSIDTVVQLADKARRQGLLSLEEDAANTKDEFLRDALQNIADGTDGDELRDMLDDAIDTKIKSDGIASKFFATLGGYAPTVGIIGTVVSLTHVLENLSDPATLGPMIASAFVATLWGLLSANFIWLPIGSRLARLSELEVERMTLVMEGVLAVQAGSQPTLLRERLLAMVPKHHRVPQKKSSKNVNIDPDEQMKSAA
ncbi:flagellar motor protein MotA [Arthrobacter alpinus]|uniref:Flagellar motor protein MotA n=1 Tax=Arthrobacter alpinus TaxID=656366 RepID=A0A0M4RQS2_9MICC|nr:MULTISPECIES: MotA/TolQ/ExbB proton channel family protein [Arthrobacter]ALE93458.1 flagellar motor protein MotA [Arthrobacter alpinus]